VSGLGSRSLEFAKRYVALVEALQGQGVPEVVARSEARMTALIMMFENADKDQCPLCGHRMEL